MIKDSAGDQWMEYVYRSLALFYDKNVPGRGRIGHEIGSSMSSNTENVFTLKNMVQNWGSI